MYRQINTIFLPKNWAAVPLQPTNKICDGNGQTVWSVAREPKLHWNLVFLSVFFFIPWHLYNFQSRNLELIAAKQYSLLYGSKCGENCNYIYIFLFSFLRMLKLKSIVLFLAFYCEQFTLSSFKATSILANYFLLSERKHFLFLTHFSINYFYFSSMCEDAYYPIWP